MPESGGEVAEIEDRTYFLKHIAELLHTGIITEQEGRITSYEENPQYNPLCRNEALRRRLRETADSMELPVIIKDDYEVYFVCIRMGADEYCMAGPMAAVGMNRVERHRFYHAYGIEERWEKGLHYRPVMDVFLTAGMLAERLTGRTYTERCLVEANRLSAISEDEEKNARARFEIKEEDADIYRHSYQEERRLLDMVREGNVEEAVRISKQMDPEIGRLGKREIEHWRNVLVIAATLCARAAIEGGVMPYVAYRVSGFYINKGSECTNATEILTYRNHAVEELARRVREARTKRHTSSYTEQCRDYVQKHYREKIYLEEIAESLGISVSYLSRLFRKETGMRFQDYVTEVRIERAANLLIYSEESLPRIAEYVNFPSQSYFGKVFKEKKHMTPRQYREMYKPLEFYEKKE